MEAIWLGEPDMARGGQRLRELFQRPGLHKIG
jgi:hypothetical protein